MQGYAKKKSKVNKVYKMQVNAPDLCFIKSPPPNSMFYLPKFQSSLPTGNCLKVRVHLSVCQYLPFCFCMVKVILYKFSLIFSLT